MSGENVEESQTLATRREALSMGATVGSAALLSNVSADTVLAQSGGPTDEISGTVEDSNGPVEGATVVAVPHDQSLSALVTTTDSNGDYIFEQSDLYEGENLYHVIARDGTESDPRRGEQNYPFIAAQGPAAIPDSAVLQYSPSTFSTGDGTWADDANNADMSMVGDPQATTFNDGSPAIATDGVDDIGRISMPSSLEGTDLEAFSFETELEYTATDRMVITGTNGGNQEFWIDLNIASFGDPDVGNIRGILDDQNDTRFRFDTSEDDLNLNDGVKHKISISIEPPTNSVSIYLDGSSATANVTSSNTPNSFGGWGRDVGTFGRWDNSVSFPYEGKLGKIRWHNEAISSQTI